MNAYRTVALKRQIYQVLDELPPSGFNELIQFLDYLEYKYIHKAGQGRKAVKLKGLWDDIPFDVTDQDIRHLRQQISAQSLHKM